jgi:hypothetical protein
MLRQPTERKYKMNAVKELMYHLEWKYQLKSTKSTTDFNCVPHPSMKTIEQN